MREKLFILIAFVLVCCGIVSGQAFASRNSSTATVGQTCQTCLQDGQTDQLTGDDSPGEQQATGFFKKMRNNVFSYLQQNVPFISRVYIGMGYRSASNPDTTGESDCSNLVNAITRNSLIGTDYDFAPNGISSQDLRENCQYVSLWDLKPGDLIFFSKGRRHNIIYHVGVITKVLFGTVHFVHASSNYGVVETVSGSETWRHYWGKKLHSFGRWKPDVFIKKSAA
ncbi:MAG: C40 family peptidase [Nitrospirae bacterium]|nr:C40 family peptidase [Nitrospirota bacterium]